MSSGKSSSRTASSTVRCDENNGLIRPSLYAGRDCTYVTAEDTVSCMSVGWLVTSSWQLVQRTARSRTEYDESIFSPQR